MYQEILFDPNDSKNESNISQKVSRFTQAENAAVELCNLLSSNYSINKNDEMIQLCYNHLVNIKNEHGRIVYSAVSNYIFNNLDSKKLDTLINNTESLIELLDNEDFKKSGRIKTKDENEFSIIHRMLTKFFDHIQLAVNQQSLLTSNEEKFKEQFNLNLQPESIKLLEKMDEKLTENSNNVISLIALFTAMAFLVFGGLSSFESILSNMHQVSILKLIVLSCVWGFGILNGIAIFMFFTSKTIGKNFAFPLEDTEKKTLYKRYPYIVLGNFILLSIFILSSWIYFCIRNSGENKVLNFSLLDTSNGFVVIGGCLVSLLLIKYLHHLFFCREVTKTNKNDLQNNNEKETAEE